MKTMQPSILAVALLLASSSAWAGSACQLDDGLGNVNTGGATANGVDATACGNGASAGGFGSVAVGSGAQSAGDLSIAVGQGSAASGQASSALGAGSTASGDQSTASGIGSTASGLGSVATGTGSTASGEQSVAAGSSASASGVNATAIGASSSAGGANATALGNTSNASGDNSAALGNNASATAADSVAIGGNSVADRANTVSFGAAGSERQLVNVAAATQDTDAVNLSQLNTLSGALGGGASFGGGVFTPPTYVIQGSSFNDVGSAFGAVDGRLTDLYGRIAAIPAGPGGSALSANYTDASKTQLALEGAGGTRVSNVANGTAATDAANVGQVQAGDAQTLRSANTYTDSRVAQMLAAPTEAVNRLRDDMNWRFAKQDERIDKMGAMTAAMVQMSASASGLRTQNRVAVGAGFQGGEQALSIGYQRAISDRATVTVGGAFSDSESSVGVGAGFGW
ncbi:MULTISPECIES: YadA-like family protein [Lysobacter]|uniref:YadA-like family protein n=1 Tax=Lysobacter TaxID=68 RepID=UPI001F1E1CDE|nr:MULTISPECIES: YadA-like family protein [Lysobacter]UJB17487.1 YadA-like family protein [Lysobacter capsici]UJQ28790.1 YadA-like family protein [Lysobacter gummosus]